MPRKGILLVVIACIGLCFLLSGCFSLGPGASVSDVRYIAHRGIVEAGAVENSPSAFETAASTSGIWGIETDIWRTADGDFACIHGTSEGAVWAGMDVVETDMETLSSQQPDGVGLCHLSEYLEACKDGGKVAVIELKDPRFVTYPQYGEEVVDAVAMAGMLDKAVFISFYHVAAARASEHAKDRYGEETDCYALANSSQAAVDEAVSNAVEMKMTGISVSSGILSYGLSKAQETGVKCGAWTYNDEDKGKVAAKMGAATVTIEYAPSNKSG